MRHIEENSRENIQVSERILSNPMTFGIPSQGTTTIGKKKRSRLLLVNSYVDGVASSYATIFTSQISRVKHSVSNNKHLELVTRSGMRIDIVFDIVQEAWAWRSTLYSRRTNFRSVLFVLDASISSVPYASQIDWADPFTYCRPSFLGFPSQDKVQETSSKETDSEDDDEEEDDDLVGVLRDDRQIRLNTMDQNFGYAECRSVRGKSKRNEDFASYTFGQVHDKRYEAWVLWDGHSSWRCARLATCLYEDVLRSELLRQFNEGKGECGEKIVMALQESFTTLDRKIRKISETCEKSIKGGAAMIVVFRCGNVVWVANAGDCQAVVATEHEEEEENTALNVCDTHTVTNERRRLQRIAYENPKLLGGVFSRRIFEPPSGMKKFRGRWTPRDTDIGTSVQCWDFDSDLSVSSKITRSDVMSEKSQNGCLFKSPMICGKHLFGVIQCSRGIGDYNLRAGHENILVKPFLSSKPCIVQLQHRVYADDSKQVSGGFMIGRFQFLIVATDGLWDSVSHEDAANIVRQVVIRGGGKRKNILTLAADALVRHVRRRSNDGTNRWEGSLDDISVFVIPMGSFSSLCRQRQRRHQSSRLVRQQRLFGQYKLRSSLRSLTTSSLISPSNKSNHEKIRCGGGFSSTPKHRDRNRSEEYGLRWEACVNEEIV